MFNNSLLNSMLNGVAELYSPEAFLESHWLACALKIQLPLPASALPVPSLTFASFTIFPASSPPVLSCYLGRGLS